MKTIAVIPVYNEAKHIASVVAGARSHADEVIVVDDASHDASGERAVGAGARVLTHGINLGKASAMKTGCEAALLRGADVILLLDGDGQHDPHDIPRFLKEFEDRTVDVVFGSRIDRASMPLIRKAGTALLEYCMRFLFGMRSTDMQCGYRGLRASAYPALRWESKRYHADAEITAAVGKRGINYRSVPIRTIYQDPYKGMTVLDGLSLLGKLFVWKFFA